MRQYYMLQLTRTYAYMAEMDGVCWGCCLRWRSSSFFTLLLTCVVLANVPRQTSVQTVLSVTDSLNSFHICKLVNPSNPSTAILKCPIAKASGSETFGPLSWFYMHTSGKLTNISHLPRIYIQGNNNEQLLIVSAAPTDSGTYVALSLRKPRISSLAICNFTLSVEELGTHTQGNKPCDTRMAFSKMNVLVRPAVMATVLEDKPYCLKSRAVGNATSHFYNFRNSQPITSNSSRVRGIGTSVLCVQVMVDDNGTTFALVSASTAGRSPYILQVVVQQVTFTVKERTRLVNNASTTNISVMAGDTVSIRCFARGRSPSISFHFNENPVADYTNSSMLVQSGDVVMNFSKINASLVRLVATIGNVQIKHGGCYKCQAKGVGGTDAEDEAMFYISVAERPSVSIKRGSCAGSRLFCTVRGSPLPVVSWQHDGKPVRAGAVQRLISTYELTSTLDNDGKAGQYICYASNSVGNSSAIFAYNGNSCASEETSSRSFAWVVPAVLGPLALILVLFVLLRLRAHRRRCKCTSTTKCLHCAAKAGARAGTRPCGEASYTNGSTVTTVAYTDSHTTISDCSSSSHQMLQLFRDSPASIGSTTRIVSVTKRSDVTDADRPTVNTDRSHRIKCTELRQESV